jgi:4-hydroxy-2-oxoheptanedioate aldolase
MIRENKTKAKIKRGDVVFGVISTSGDALLAEWCGLAGFDFYMADVEHGPITLVEAEQIVRACETVGVTPLVRLGQFDAKLLAQYLDVGMLGAMQPGLKRGDDVRAMVSAIKYPPLGTRGLGPSRANDFFMGRLLQAEYVKFANEQTLVLPQFEEPDMFGDLNAIVRMQGVDGIVIGPRDLALNLGFADSANHPEVQNLIGEAMAIGRGAGVAVGLPAATGELAQKQIERGANFVLISTHTLLQQGAKDFLRP